MPLVSIVFGLILIALGLEGYTNQLDLFHVKTQSLTALIPAGFGIALVLCGLIAFKPGARKHAMHVAAMLGLIGFVAGGIMGFHKLPEAIEKDRAGPKLQSLMAAVCGIFLALCVMSFINARKRRLAQQSITTRE